MKKPRTMAGLFVRALALDVKREEQACKPSYYWIPTFPKPFHTRFHTRF